jgi:hypothetical protein
VVWGLSEPRGIRSYTLYATVRKVGKERIEPEVAWTIDLIEEALVQKGVSCQPMLTSSAAGSVPEQCQGRPDHRLRQPGQRLGAAGT